LDAVRNALRDQGNEETTCLAVFDAPLVGVEVRVPGAPMYVGNAPRIPELSNSWSRVTVWPELIQGSESPMGSFIWVALLSKPDCELAKSSPLYLGSSQEDFATLPPETRARFLRVPGWCEEKLCLVPAGDTRAIPGEIPRLPVKLEPALTPLAGRVVALLGQGGRGQKRPFHRHIKKPIIH
jgi:hypothetical protein